MVFNRMSGEELRLAKQWYDEDGKTPLEISLLLRRDKSTITRHVVKRTEQKRDGRPRALTESEVDALESLLVKMIKKANREYEVTLEMLRKEAKCRASVKTIQRELHKRNIYWHAMREKPALTQVDVEDRLRFAGKFASKSAAWWRGRVHMHIDCKHFPLYVNGRSRSHARQTSCRGAYRKPGQGLDTPYTKPTKKLKFNTGVRNTMVLAGAGNGKVMVWEYIDGRNWNGAVAEEMYRGPILRALQREYPGRRRWTILEDNDPAGFKSSKGLRAKADVGVKSFDLPKRSPALNVCDFALWTEVNRRMRKQEKRWPYHKKESRAEHMARLRRTARNLPEKFINDSIGDLRRRCGRLLVARGGHFEEG